MCQRLKLHFKSKEFESIRIQPLYSQLTPEKQQEIFSVCPVGVRQIVVATNVAETSLTIPGIRYVVDTGRTKEKTFDKCLQISKFGVAWISRASAEQRAGRAGRTGPGYCYRLYSNALFSKMDEFSEPEILKTPLDQIVLLLKSLGAKDLLQFPFVTMPPIPALVSSLRHLTILGALDVEKREDLDKLLELKMNTDVTEINELGCLLSKLPLSPKFSKMLVVSTKYSVLCYTIMIVACLSVNEIFKEIP